MLKKLLKHLKSFLPRKLPIGMSSFQAWLDDVLYLSGLPDNESTRKVAATLILKLPPGLAYLSIRKISNQLIKAAANQVAVELLRPQSESKDTAKEVVSQAPTSGV